MNVDVDILKRHAAQLGEHFDSVQIFCTRKEMEGTLNCRYGIGDWFARYGHVKMWLVTEENTGLHRRDDTEV